MREAHLLFFGEFCVNYLCLQVHTILVSKFTFFQFESLALFCVVFSTPNYLEKVNNMKYTY